jgi:hypothetical protein
MVKDNLSKQRRTLKFLLLSYLHTYCPYSTLIAPIAHLLVERGVGGSNY